MKDLEEYCEILKSEMETMKSKETQRKVTSHPTLLCEHSIECHDRMQLAIVLFHLFWADVEGVDGVANSYL